MKMISQETEKPQTVICPVCDGVGKGVHKIGNKLIEIKCPYCDGGYVRVATIYKPNTKENGVRKNTL
jgi:hypothetical protein